MTRATSLIACRRRVEGGAPACRRRIAGAAFACRRRIAGAAFACRRRIAGGAPACRRRLAGGAATCRRWVAGGAAATIAAGWRGALAPHIAICGALVPLIATALLLASCGGGGHPTPAAEPAASPTPSIPAAGRIIHVGPL